MDNQIQELESDLALAEDAIKKGERVRVLFDILLSEMGVNRGNLKGSDFWLSLQEIQKDYEEAVQMLTLIVQSQKKD